jgi:hypothetical protein
MRKPFTEVLDDCRACGVGAIERKPSLCPVRYLRPITNLLTADRRLPVHLDDRDAAELIHERWSDDCHLGVVLLAEQIELVKSRSERIATLVQALAELAQHEVSIKGSRSSVSSLRSFTMSCGPWWPESWSSHERS